MDPNHRLALKVVLPKGGTQAQLDNIRLALQPLVAEGVELHDTIHVQQLPSR